MGALVATRPRRKPPARWCWRPALVGLVLVLACTKTGGAPKKARAPDGFLRGVGLGLFASDDGYDYATLLDEIVAHGATDVLLVVPWYQTSVDTHDIAPRAGFSPAPATVARTIRQARARGLRVAVLPIVRLTQRTRTQWRGRIQPAAGIDAWFAAYETFVVGLAKGAQAAGAQRFGVGSELLSLERHEAHWRALIKKVRGVFAGKLFYSANWDHFDPIRFWDALDEVAVTAYFELTRSEAPPTREQLRAGWERPAFDLQRLSRRVGRPVFISEVGYPSIVTAARYPWDETRKAPVDLALQATLYDVFCDVMKRTRPVDGFFFWNWFGFGGADDTGYTPRKKPAAAAMKKCLFDPAHQKGPRPAPPPVPPAR